MYQAFLSPHRKHSLNISASTSVEAIQQRVSQFPFVDEVGIRTGSMFPPVARRLGIYLTATNRAIQVTHAFITATHPLKLFERS